MHTIVIQVRTAGFAFVLAQDGQVIMSGYTPDLSRLKAIIAKLSAEAYTFPAPSDLTPASELTAALSALALQSAPAALDAITAVLDKVKGA